jgi:alpha/beta superfamily hydrolase
VREDPRFVTVDGDPLFTVLHTPAGTATRGVVLCHPLGEEKLWSHRVFVTFARELAERGLAVIRFDFRGEGDSGRDFLASDLDTRVADVHAAIDVLREAVPAVTGLTLVGLRFGGSVAAVCASGRTDVERLVIWDPVPDGAAYMQAVLRTNIAAQMALHRKVITDREAMVATLEAGGAVNIEGYDLGLGLYRAASTLMLADVLPRCAGRTLLVQIGAETLPPRKDLAALAAASPRVETRQAAEEPFWREIKTFYQRADRLFPATIDWLEAGA